MRAMIFASLVLFAGLAAFTSPAAADESDEQSALIDQVMSGLRENDLRLGTANAHLRMVAESSFRRGTQPIPRPPQDPPVQKPKRIGVPVDATAVLHVDPHPVFVVEWTAQIAGENRRFEVQTPNGRDTFSLDRAGITHQQGQRALITPWDDAKSFLGHMQYDPREIGFLTLAETLLRLRQLGNIESARTIEREDNERIIELKAKSLMPEMSIVIECSSRLNLLPTRLYYVREGRVNSVSDMTYQQVRSDPSPAWFLKSAVRRNAVMHQNKSPDDKEWGQTITVEVTDLQLDAIAPPPRDDERSLPAGTSIQNRMPQPPPAPVPDEPIVSSFSVLATVASAVIAIAILLALYGLSIRKTDA